MRIFSAVNIKPGEKLFKTLGILEDKLGHEKISWISPDKLHITLKFFGETEEKKLQQIINIHKTIIDSYSSFTINIESIGVFGSEYKPRVIWLGLNPAQDIKDISMEISAASNTIGFKADRQNIAPHLTIGRIKSIQNKKLFNNIISPYKTESFQEVIVDKVNLFESILTSKGAFYKIIDEFKLK